MLELNYDFDEEDFLQLQMYFASKDEMQIKQRKKEKYKIMGLSFLCGLLLFFDEGYRLLSYFFLGSSVFFFAIYPWWSVWFYKRMYRKHISESSRADFPYNTKLLFGNDVIELETKKGHRHFSVNDMDAIIETGYYFFITMSYEVTIIIPKHRINNVEEVRTHLLRYNEYSHVSFVEDLNWKWR
ncbi:YcxB family protein [Dysgonomonas termitidis]|uniref:YcxB family protein n=1 Tax=Dysgonomonas termitidis TaxID=1516126 RepID=A0ABV9KZH4_9BACT